MNQDYLNKFKEMDDLEKIGVVCEQAKSVKYWLKKRNKASEAYFNYKGARTGVRGGKRTALDANLSNYAEMYDSSVADLKKLTSLM